MRGGEIALIFQEPMTSFSPVHTVGNQMIETIRLHLNVDKRAGARQAIEMLQAGRVFRGRSAAWTSTRFSSAAGCASGR